jgi:hypothetical protein
VIHINDVNDMPPVFNTSLYPAIMEEELPGPYPHSLLKVNSLTIYMGSHNFLVVLFLRELLRYIKVLWEWILLGFLYFWYRIKLYLVW